MKNLHTKRFTGLNQPQDQAFKSEWVFCSVPNVFQPCRWRAGQQGGYVISLISVSPKRGRYEGSVPVHDVIRLRANTLQELREKIIKAYPSAAFTTGDNPAVDSVKQAYLEARENKPATADEIRAAWTALTREYGTPNKNGVKELLQGDEITWEMCQRCGIRKGVFAALQERSQRDEIATLTSASREVVSEWPLEKQEEMLHIQLQDFVNNGSWGWREWFAARPGFLDYHGGWNKTQLLSYCEKHGFGKVPTHLELAQAMLYLLRHNHFAMREKFLRSQTDELRALKPYVQDVPLSESASEQEIRDAFSKLTARFGSPVRVTPEHCQACGISEKTMLALRARFTPTEDVKDKSATQLKEELREERNRKGPRSFRSNLTGY